MGVCLGYYIRDQKQNTSSEKMLHRNTPVLSHSQRLYSKGQHSSDSDRIRDLNQLSTHQAAFFRLLKQIFLTMKFRLKISVFLF